MEDYEDCEDQPLATRDVDCYFNLQALFQHECVYLMDRVGFTVFELFLAQAPRSDTLWWPPDMKRGPQPQFPTSHRHSSSLSHRFLWDWDMERIVYDALDVITAHGFEIKLPQLLEFLYWSSSGP